MTTILPTLTTPVLLLATAAAALLTALGTGLARRYALRNALLDVPNHRSSHATPTPRGGGVAIATVFLAALALAGVAGLIPARLAMAFVGGGAAIAIVGWIDDRQGVRASRRAATHFAAAIWGVAWLDGLPVVRFGLATWHPGPLGFVLAVVGTVWFVNFYNFMDGIDGIAGGNALVASVVGAVMLLRAGDASLAFVSLVLAGCSLGFLAWNWPPARIFMGDIGSGLLGYLFALLAIASEQRATASVLLWVMLMAVFVVDATLTLVRRVLRGERWYDAHRSHAYQRLVQSGRSHRTVTLLVILLDAALGALALAVSDVPRAWVPCLVAAFVALGLLYLWTEQVHPMAPPVLREPDRPAPVS